MNTDFIIKDGILVPNYVEKNLHGGVWAQFSLTVVDANGKITDYKEAPCRSFVRNFGRFWRQVLYVPDITPEQYDDDGGVGRNYNLFDENAGNNEGPIANVGMLKVGDSNTAVLSTQDNLQGTIMEVGNGDNGGVAVSTTTVTEDGSQSQWYYTATITNTGSSFTVREIGLFARLADYSVAAQSRRTMMIRDTVSDTIIPNGSSAIPKYTITVAI